MMDCHKFTRDIQCPKRMTCDALMFPLAPPTFQTYPMKYFDIYWVNWDKILHTHLCCLTINPDNEDSLTFLLMTP